MHYEAGVEGLVLLGIRGKMVGTAVFGQLLENRGEEGSSDDQPPGPGAGEPSIN